MAILFDCPSCGRRLQVPDTYRGKRTKCPQCAAVSTVPGEPDVLPVAVEQTAIQDAPPGGGTVRVPMSAGEGEALGVADLSPTCPSCRKVLERGAVLCVACGHDLRTGKQIEMAHERYDQKWDTGLPMPLRLGLLMPLEIMCLLGGALLMSQDAFAGVCLIFAGSVFLALILGTYIHLHLVRTTRGKVWLTRTWYICFVPCIRHEVNVRSFDRILIDASGVDWASVITLVALFLACGVLGVILLAWRIHFGPGRFHVYLRNDRRKQDFSLYHSVDDQKMRELVETLHELTDLRIDRR
jgi:hypothetical protein